VTGSRIVSPGAIVRKSNMPALSKKVLSLVWCRLLRKFVGSVTDPTNASRREARVSVAEMLHVVGRKGLFRVGVVGCCG